MVRERGLQDMATGKRWHTRCEGAVVRVRAGLPGKEKDSEKPQADAAAAVAWAQKEEWARLKKGFVLVDATAKAGSPRMHRHVGGGYTGALLATDVGGRLLSNRSSEDGDTLLLLDGEAQLTVEAPAPAGHLVWDAVDAPVLGRVLLSIDHRLYAWSPAAPADFEPLAAGNRSAASFLSVAGTRVAGIDATDLVVRDLASDRELFRRPMAPQLYGGHTPQMAGALSARGLLAWCTQAGEVQFFDLAASAERPAWRGGFEMIDTLRFTPDGRHLLAQERYGGWTLLCFDTETGAPRGGWPAFGDLSNGDFALDPSGRRMAVAHGGHVEVFDFATMKRLLRFPVEHVVRRCRIAWVGDDTLGVRTDYGCASLYAVN